MVKGSVKFICSNCGALSSSWSGRCYNCGEWNTLEEQIELAGNARSVNSKPLSAQSVSTLVKVDTLNRISTNIKEVDEVLGGGFVAGSVTLFAGQPGIGKSTLLLQISDSIAHQHEVLYVSGEESAHQVGLRAERLGAKASNLKLATTNQAEEIEATIESGAYKVVVVDSIQTISLAEISSSPGSISQITNCARVLSAAAKQTNTALVMVGHVTKEGSIAGPKILEHLVDVVMQLEGDRVGGFKVLRSEKNRYGSTNEVGIFEMLDEGLKPINNPSAALLSERQATDGSIVYAAIEGSRPLLVEVQALVNRTGYGYPKRAASGIDLNRVNLLIAMIERRTKLNLTDQDVYINIVGGIRITEPAADLAICIAIASAARGMQLIKNAVVFGEVGLSGEVRHVPFIEKRCKEAKKLGFVGAIGPNTKPKPTGLFVVKDLKTALNQFLEKD